MSMFPLFPVLYEEHRRHVVSVESEMLDYLTDQINRLVGQCLSVNDSTRPNWIVEEVLDVSLTHLGYSSGDNYYSAMCIVRISPPPVF